MGGEGGGGRPSSRVGGSSGNGEAAAGVGSLVAAIRMGPSDHSIEARRCCVQRVGGKSQEPQQGHQGGGYIDRELPPNRDHQPMVGVEGRF